MKRLIHKAIQWYLRRCGGVFHTNPYGPSGRYVVLMNEYQYHEFSHAFLNAPPRPAMVDELEDLLRETATSRIVNADGSVTL